MKIVAGNIIILPTSTKNQNHMMHGSWDMKCDRQNFLSLLTVFCPFTPLPTYFCIKKIKILKKYKNTLRYYHFTYVYHKWQSYDAWYFRYGVKQTIFFVILNRFCPFTDLTALKNQNFEKRKKALKIPSSYTSVPKIMIIC